MNLISTEIPPGLLPSRTLSMEQRNEMFALLSRYFEGVTRMQFDRDLAEKNWVVEVRRAGQLLGFSTLLATEYSRGSGGDPIAAIYSGDTIMSPEAWSSPALARGWIAAVNHLRAGFDGLRCYWLLLSSGFRTYRFLPVFWREFHPRYDAPTPPAAQGLMDALAASRYGSTYDAAAGIVRFPQPQRLAGGLESVPSGRGTVDPHVAYFFERNPGHADGDELVCMAEISETNLTGAGWRMVRGKGVL